jgi:SHS2 domain-containing protein
MEPARSGYEFLEHTADVKLHVWGPTLERLFAVAADGFYHLLGELTPAGDGERLRIELQAPDLTDLLHDWLAELLFRFDTHGQCVEDFFFQEITNNRLVVEGRVWPVDAARSRFDSGVKAVTYHGLDVTKQAGRFEATVILDL